MLPLEPLIHLSAGAYEAWIAPAAGGRLVRLLWHGLLADIECVVPITPLQAFAPHAWPKQGAFAMLPYGNRLENAGFEWHGQRIQLAPPPGQLHGLHGVGHRHAWTVMEEAPERVRLRLTHQATPDAWPWSFEAVMDYRLGATGLSLVLQLKNTSTQAMPASLGWHPYLPLPDGPASLTVHATSLHDLGPQGLLYPRLAAHALARAPFAIPLEQPQTVAAMQWDGALLLPLTPDAGLSLRASGAEHLVVHVPTQPGYVCVEPVTALPGALQTYTAAQRERHLALEPGAVRQMACALGVAPAAEAG